jgi:hypothetical protein
MQALRFIAVPSALVEKVRTSGASPGYGHPAHTEVATGYGPCRHCLRTFQVGDERRTLFTYDPFHELEPVPLPGPVYIHAEPCERYDEASGFPADLLDHPLTLVAYGDGRRTLDEVHVTGDAVRSGLERLFALHAVRYVHVRDRSAGCFDLRVERVAAQEVSG